MGFRHRFTTLAQPDVELFQFLFLDMPVPVDIHLLHQTLEVFLPNWSSTLIENIPQNGFELIFCEITAFVCVVLLEDLLNSCVDVFLSDLFSLLRSSFSCTAPH